MINNKGTTLVELLVVFVLGGMMLLAAGTITDIGKQSHKKLLDEADIYNGITYGFKLIQNRIHEGGFIAIETPAAPWVGQRLVVGSEAFGVYDQTGDMQDFVYLPDKDDANNRQTIVSVPDSDTITSAFTIVGDTVTVTLSGTKESITFNITTTVCKRI